MHFKRLLWRLYLPYLAIILVSLLVIALYAINSLKHFYFDRISSDLETRAILLEKQVKVKLIQDDIEWLKYLCNELGEETSTRITVVLPSGKVIADSEENPEQMDNHADRPEIAEALNGQTGSSIRYSYTLKENHMYLAVPVKNTGTIIAVLRTSVTLASIDKALRDIYYRIAMAGVIVSVLVAFISLIISRRISKPLEGIKTGAQQFAQGRLDHRLPMVGPDEVASLAKAMNEMAAQLDNHIRAIVRQRNELDVVLSSMVESVIAVNNDEKIINLNSAAAILLGTDTKAAIDRSVQEVVRNTDLQRFISKALSSVEPVHGELIIQKGGERFLAATGTSLRDAQGKKRGALVVLNDVTDIRKLATIRKEFVANVSHEIRTPVTSIKGFVETLLDGAMQNHEDLKRFLDIILKQTNRLNAIIEDLLTLSRIEREAESPDISFEKVNLREVLKSAIELCEIRAKEKYINVKLDCPEDMEVSADPASLEQAVTNLVDNAVKYSDPESNVEVEAFHDKKETIIKVIDHGPGIEGEHLSRLFERFYRVDKARSRDMGGTGLGLAIVKHIVLLHKGTVNVESTSGKGSVFIVSIPIA